MKIEKLNDELRDAASDAHDNATLNKEYFGYIHSIFSALQFIDSANPLPSIECGAQQQQRATSGLIDVGVYLSEKYIDQCHNKANLALSKLNELDGGTK